MNLSTNLPNRRSFLKGVSLGAGGLLFAPLLQKIAAAVEGNVTTPKRVIFFLFDNGSSAWSRGSPIAIQCRPENAYASLFGSIGATGNDFLARKNLLDFIANDVRRLQSRIAGPEKDLVEQHLESLESLSKRDEQMSRLQEAGSLRRRAPKLPATPPTLMTEISAAQCLVDRADTRRWKEG